MRASQSLAALIHVRGKKPLNRTLSQPTPEVRRFWKFATVGGTNLLVAIIGGIVALTRRRPTVATTTRQTAKHL